MRIIAVLLVIISVFCAVTEFPEDVKAVEKKPIKIGYDLWPGYAALFIADENGYFTEEGLDIEIIEYADYLNGWADFVNNELDGHFGVFSDTLVKYSEGINIQTVFFTDASYGGDVIVAKKEIQTINDLKGKKISVIGINSFSHIWVLTLLERNGLQEYDVQFANIGNSHVPEALASGEIDAGHTYGPYISEAINAGNHILSGATTKDVHGIIIDDLAFHSTFIKKRPDDISKIIKALNRGVQFLQTNPQESYGIISKILKMNSEDVEGYYQDAIIFDVENNKQLMNKNTPDSIYEAAEAISDFLLKRGQLSEILDFDKIIESKFINQFSKE
jgi:NitT/TauT family transport system substrate-binding protein